eukprot:gene13238-15556_t
MTKLGDQYIAASYVKYVESGGARVAPIFYDIEAEDLKTLLSQINGVLLPGGGVDLNTQPAYYETLQLIWEYIITANDNADPMPLWGTCMGFQQLNMLAAKDLSILSYYNSENYTVPLDFTNLASGSRLFQNATQDIMTALATKPITMNNHMYGVAPTTFSATSSLYSFYDALSWNTDRVGNTFLSTIEAKNYPIYGTQWHPEKPLFEWWNQEVMDHSFESIKANQYTSNFFVNECRKSSHSFASQQSESAALIYNYQPVYSFDIEPDFEQVYYFKNISN